MDAPFHRHSNNLANHISGEIHSNEQNAPSSDAGLCQNKLFLEAYSQTQKPLTQEQLVQNELAREALVQEEIIEMSRLLLLEIRLLSAIARSYRYTHDSNYSFNYTAFNPAYGGGWVYPNLYTNNLDSANPAIDNQDIDSQDISPQATNTQNTNNLDRHNHYTSSRQPDLNTANKLHRYKPLGHFAHLTSNLAHHVIHPLGSTASSIVSAAKHNIGRPVWAFTKFASVCQSGYEGCAATVSELLQEGGISIAGSPCVSGLVNQLSALGWHRIKINNKHQFQVGDIVYGLKGSHAHIGIISEANNNQVLVCDNSSSSGTLKERSLESGGSFTPNGRFAGSLYVMRFRDS